MQKNNVVKHLSLEGLSSDEQFFLRDLVTLGEVSKPVQKEDRVAVSIEEWINSSYYVGSLAETLYPFWKNHLIKIFSGKGSFEELIVTGALSTGKTFFCNVVWLRIIYLLSLKVSPQLHLRLDPTSRIFLVFLSISLREAEITGFGDFRRMVDTIPYFVNEFPRDPNINTMLIFPKGITVLSGSDVVHFIGANLISLIFDEANFAKVGGGKPGDIKKAWDIYLTARLRVKTRFSEKTDIPLFNMLVSSTTHKSSFTEQLIKSSREDRFSKVIVARLFEVKDKGIYSDQRFLFFLGDDLAEAKVIENKEQLVTQKILHFDDVEKLSDVGVPVSSSFSLSEFPEEVRGNFILVPMDFYGEAQRFPDRVVRDVVGDSVAAKNRFFTSKLDFNAAVYAGETSGLRHPFTKVEISVGLKDRMKIIDFLDREYIINRCAGHPCFIHVDQSVSVAATGIAMAYPFEDETTGQFGVVVPLIVRLLPPGKGDQISISKCREFIEDLIEIGIDVKLVTYDTFQSVNSIQTLTIKGINTGNFSTVRKDEPWIDVSDLFYSRKLRIYDYKPFRSEWFSLIHDKEARKVICPVGGSKDLADAFLGAVANAWASVEKQEFAVRSNRTMCDILSSIGKMGAVKGKSLGGLLDVSLHEEHNKDFFREISPELMGKL